MINDYREEETEMINDYSEVTCHLQRDVVNLINALNDKNWIEAMKLAENMRGDMQNLTGFAWNAYCAEWINNESK